MNAPSRLKIYKVSQDFGPVLEFHSLSKLAYGCHIDVLKNMRLFTPKRLWTSDLYYIVLIGYINI